MVQDDRVEETSLLRVTTEERKVVLEARVESGWSGGSLTQFREDLRGAVQRWRSEATLEKLT